MVHWVIMSCVSIIYMEQKMEENKYQQYEDLHKKIEELLRKTRGNNTNNMHEEVNLLLNCLSSRIAAVSIVAGETDKEVNEIIEQGCYSCCEDLIIKCKDIHEKLKSIKTHTTLQ